MKLERFINNDTAWETLVKHFRTLFRLARQNKGLFFSYVFSFMFLVSPYPEGVWFFMIPISLYCCWKRRFKKLFRLYAYFFFSWYILFVGLTFGIEEDTIIIGAIHKGLGSPNTALWFRDITSHFHRSFFYYFIVTTFFSVGKISWLIGQPIYVYSIFKGLWALREWISKM